MTNNLDYIDNYYKGSRSVAETKEFEQRILTDTGFAEDVAFYLSALQEASEQAAEEKRARFKTLPIQSNESEKAKVKPLKKWWPYIAAAAIITGIIIGWYVFFQPVSLQQQADRYIQNELQTLPVTMSTQADSMQKGLRLVNEGKLEEALLLFENIAATDTSSYTAKKNAGIVSLRMQQYDKALGYFKQLENHTGLYANPALFFQALTLLKRNLPGDEQKARQLLEQVVNQDLEGKDPAQRWLKKS